MAKRKDIKILSGHYAITYKRAEMPMRCFRFLLSGDFWIQGFWFFRRVKEWENAGNGNVVD